MIVPEKLNKNDTVSIISLSSGILGENYAKHQLNLAVKRLNELGLQVKFMENSLKGIEYLKNHPEKRAEDLKKAFNDENTKMIICAIGGNDTYKTIPYLLEDRDFIESVKNNPKIFTGFSDTTINHLMFYKLGLRTYYGMNILNDISELSGEMLPYTKKYFLEYFKNSENLKIKSSDIWYEERTDFSNKELNKNRISHKELRGFELIQGKEIFSGELYGGCIESLYSIYINEEENKIMRKYNLIPEFKDLENKILFIETSEDKSSPEKLRKMLIKLMEKGLFENINGLLVGKPQDEKYYEEYKEIYRELIPNSIPIVYNVNFGHSYPRTILAYGTKIEVNMKNREITYLEKILR